jgi:excisionase family DNA binding protein
MAAMDSYMVCADNLEDLTMDNIEKWSSMATITDYLDVSRETILQWINHRNMPAHKVGRLWKFKKSEVDEWIRSGGGCRKTDPDE